MTNLPTVIFNEAAAIDAVVGLIDELRERIAAPRILKWLELKMHDQLRTGLLGELQVIEWAERGDVIADAALRMMYAEMRNHHEEPSVLVEAYIIKTIVRGAATRGRGHFWFDNWGRDIGITVLVYLTAETFSLHPTRNREQRRHRQASACSIVAEALGRRRINIREKTVENIWARLQGEALAYAAAHGDVVIRNVPK